MGKVYSARPAAILLELVGECRRQQKWVLLTQLCRTSWSSRLDPKLLAPMTHLEHALAIYINSSAAAYISCSLLDFPGLGLKRC